MSFFPTVVFGYALELSLRDEEAWVSTMMAVAILLLLWAIQRERERNTELQAQLELAVQRRKLILNFLHDLGEGFTEGFKIEQLLQKIAQFSVSTTQATAGAVYLFNRERTSLRAEIVIGPFPPPLRPANFNEEKFAGKPDQLERAARLQIIPVGEGLVGEVARTGKPVLIRNGARDSRLPQYIDPSLQIRTAIYMPMKFGDEVLGVMVVVNKEADEAVQIFNSADVFLADSLATHGAISLRNLSLYARQEEQKLMESDMRVASEIQRMLLPDTAPDVANFDLHALNHAAQHVSGDYYDFIPLDESHVGIVIADVSGKAVSGALIMATCRAILRAQCGMSHSPASVIANVQRQLIADLPEDMFITMIYGILDGEKRTFKFARAGHDPALWFHAATTAVEAVAPRGTAVGLGRVGASAPGLEEREIVLPAGDILVLYTDGITESLDAAQNEFGRERLVESIRASARGSVEEISEYIMQNLGQFTADSPLHDDRTLIVIKAL